jgi:hypothetical protein
MLLMKREKGSNRQVPVYKDANSRKVKLDAQNISLVLGFITYIRVHKYVQVYRLSSGANVV